MAQLGDACYTLATYTARGFQGRRSVSLQLSIPMSQETTWTVFVLKPSEMFRHHSLLFESLEGDTFCVELMVHNDEVILVSRNMDIKKHKYQGLTKEDLGTVRKSVNNVLKTAASVLQQLGSYHFVLNNCQDYCQALAKELGCRDYWSDTEKVAAVAGAVAVAGAALYSWFKTEEDKK